MVGAVVSPAAVLKAAETEALADTVTAQVPVPEHPLPDHPANVEPPLAVAVRVTLVPEFKAVDVQVEPQEMPPTDDVTVPDPVPDFVTVRVYVVGVPPPSEYPGTLVPFTYLYPAGIAV